MYRNILFDLDGTLIDSEPGIAISLRYAFSQCGISYDGDIKRFIGPPFRVSFPMFLATDEATTDKLIRSYRAKYAEVGVYKTRLFAGIRDLLFALRENGKRIALATTKPLSFAEIILRQKRIYRLFDYVAGTDVAAGGATDKKDVLDLVFRHTDFSKPESVLVGDTAYDIRGAESAGIDCVSVTYGYASEQSLLSDGARKIVGSVKKLREYLLE